MGDDPEIETEEVVMEANDSIVLPLPEAVIDEAEVLANLIYPASEDGAEGTRGNA